MPLLLETTPTAYNPGNNILELYNILVQAQVATSKTKIGI